MDVKLIKIRDGEYTICTLHKNLPKWYKMGFDLENGYYAFGANVPIGGVSDIDEHHKLSLKNCQAIERGYDLDELVIDYIGEPDKKHWHFVDHNDFVAFKDGFEKALELIGDKKFSEEDMRMAFFHVQNEPTFNEFIQSLKQKEWDVEIVMEPCYYDDSLGGFSTSYKEGMPTEQPKLDENGCLILKKK